MPKISSMNSEQDKEVNLEPNTPPLSYEGGSEGGSEELVEDPFFPVGGSGLRVRGRSKSKKMVAWEIVRSLRVPDDLPLLTESLPAPRANLKQIRHSHHRLAELLAQGTDQVEASRLTGYNNAYISVLQTDPTFKELITYYSVQKEQTFVDVIERMRSLGLSTLDELQSRLESDPSSYSNRELMEQAELTLIKPMAASRGQIQPGQAGNTGVSVNVKFVQAVSPGDAVIDVTPSSFIQNEKG